MKRPLLLLASLLLYTGMATADTGVASVAQLDLPRYLGNWYEIAHLPMFFQRHCTGDTTANYSLRPDGAIDVHNHCATASGVDDAHGKASVVPGHGNARLKVWFFWPFKANYWVIGLDPDYRWTVVGNPDRSYLWVLSRTPQLDKAQLDAALAAAVAQGYDLKPLMYTPQGGKTSAP